jgi:serine/threonine protein kinase
LIQRAELEIVRSIQGGGEGTVHEAVLPSGKRAAYKEYHHHVLDKHGAATARKLDAMIANPPSRGVDGRHRTLAWPSQVVHDGERFVGFTMPLVDPSSCKLVELTDRPGRESIGRAHWTWATMVALCRNLSSAVQVLHEARAAWGDLNEENVLVDERGLVTLIDLDTVAFRSGDQVHAGSGFTRAEWSPPSASSSPETFTKGDDLWALAVQIYILLMESHRPYATVSDNQADSQANVARKLFPILDSTLALPHGSPPLDVLPPGLTRLFRWTFGRGFDNPDSRPSAQEYATELGRILDDIQQCPSTDEHVWAPPRVTCPWCERLGVPTRAPRPAAPAAPATRVAPPSRTAGRPVPKAGPGAPGAPPFPRVGSSPTGAPRSAGGRRPHTTIHPRPAGPAKASPTVVSPPVGRKKPAPKAVAPPAAAPTPPRRPAPRPRPRRVGRLLAGLVTVAAVVLGTAALGDGDLPVGFDRLRAWVTEVVHSGKGTPGTPDEQVAADRTDVEGLVDTWVPQLASIPLDRSESEIMKQFQTLQAQHANALMLRSGDYSSFLSKNYYVIVLGQSYPSSSAVNAWCKSSPYGPTDCYAKRLRHTGTPDGNTAHWQ